MSQNQKTKETMTAHTYDWDALTTSGGGASRQPSRTARATRSATAAMSLTGDAQREALGRHFEQFAPATGSYKQCSPRL
jgi:hypothetical protein